ncbi:MAG: UvrD-helicase domain-containing protein, partial [Candidatus Cryosericum sp.]
YCEKDNEQYWVGDKAYHDFAISYTSDTARKLRFRDDPDWRKVDLDIAHGRLHSFKWHSPVETFIEVQRSGAQTTASSPRSTETPIVQRRVGYTLESIADRLLQEQDTVMRASPIGTTLISGAAGSGKTNIAIHRIDYLIQEHAERFSQYNIAVFAPKTSLTKYLRALVDSFGFRLLPIYSYDEWTVEILSNFTDVNSVGSEEDLGLAQRKSAAVMVDLMRRFLSDKTYQLEADIRNDPRLQDYVDVLDRTFEKPSPTLIGLYEAIRDALWERIDELHAQDAELVQADRQSVESALANALASGRNQEDLVDILERIIEAAFHAFPGFKKEYSSVKTRLEIYRPPLSQDRRNAWRRAASEHMLALQSVTAQFVDLMYAESRIEQLVARRIKAEKNRVAARLRAVFRRSCSVAIYTHPPTPLAHVCNTPFQLHVLPFLTEFYRSSYCWDYLGLIETPEYPFGVFELTRADVDIVMWFLYQLSRDNLADKPTSSFLHVYDHIVVDEAQDFTPLQLLFLRRLSHNSTTLAGDLTQKIFPTGMQDWAELGEPIDNHFVLTMSHRTTLETALFANALMQDASSATLTERVAYHGDRPLVARVPDEDAATAAAISYIAAVKKREPKASILLVHTRNAALKGLRDRLAAADLMGYVAKGDTWEFGQKVTVTTYRRVQGLEYDYVVVLALNDFDNMLISGDKSRILYTLATRAKKRLVFYVTDPLPTLLAKVDSSLYELD